MENLNEDNDKVKERRQGVKTRNPTGQARPRRSKQGNEYIVNNNKDAGWIVWRTSLSFCSPGNVTHCGEALFRLRLLSQF